MANAPALGSDPLNNANSVPVRVVSGGNGIANLSPLGYQQVTGLTSAKSLTVPTGATAVVVSVSGAAVRYRDDGTAPTAVLGMPIAVGVTQTFNGNLAAIQFIQQAATATLDISFYG